MARMYYRDDPNTPRKKKPWTGAKRYRLLFWIAMACNFILLGEAFKEELINLLGMLK